MHHRQGTVERLRGTKAGCDAGTQHSVAHGACIRCRISGVRRKTLHQIGHSGATMAARMLFVGRQFGKRSVVANANEERIIAEAIGAGLVAGNGAVTVSFTEDRAGIVDVAQHTPEGRSSIIMRLHAFEQQIPVRRICCIVSAVACTAYARGAAQSMDLETRVIGQGRKARCGMDKCRLDVGIGFEGVSGLVDD